MTNLQELKAIETFHVPYIKIRDLKISDREKTIQALKIGLEKVQRVRALCLELHSLMPMTIESNEGDYHFVWWKTNTIGLQFEHLPTTSGDQKMTGIIASHDLKRLFDHIEKGISGQIELLEKINL